MTTPTLPEGKYVVPALVQGLAVLNLFSREKPTLTAPEIAGRLELPRTSVFRLLHTLQLMGFVTREADERTFKLGPALLNRGFAYLASLDPVESAQPILQRLRDETGMSAHMAVRDGQEIVYVARFAGRMTICDFSDRELAALFPKEPLPAFSDQTPTTLAALQVLLVADRERGYAVSQSYFERGVSSVAAPVRDGSGRIVAAVNITSVDSYVQLDDMNGELKDRVLAACAEISGHLPDAGVEHAMRRLPAVQRGAA